jgi:hypothetical protein
MGEAGALITVILILLILLEIYYLSPHSEPSPIEKIVTAAIGSGTTGLTFASTNIPKCSGPGGNLGYDGSKWTCKCDAGWSGADCSTYNGTGSTSLNLNIPRCYSPGGSLSYNGTTWTCNCIAGWSGVGCGDFDPDKSYVIPNVPVCTAPGGTLGFDGVNWNCICALGYFGNHCDQTTTGNAGPDCHHGNGVYDSLTASWSCRCNQGWTGCNCSLPTEPPPDIPSIISTCF